MSQIQPDTIEKALDTLCDYYLPRVLQYFHYWLEDIETAERLAVETLKQAIKKIEGLDARTEALSEQIFILARQTVKIAGGNSLKKLNGLSYAECEVVALKMGAELSNRCIGNILGLSEPVVGKLLLQSLDKMKDHIGIKQAI